ncbi:hypothetical protein [Nonomuraea dietziae]|uniref:hypothetical protein n=1 Tax=Nonomuraea dietziae TaxID=65515 RepID=UPI0031DA7579
MLLAVSRRRVRPWWSGDPSRQGATERPEADEGLQGGQAAAEVLASLRAPVPGSRALRRSPSTSLRQRAGSGGRARPRRGALVRAASKGGARAGHRHAHRARATEIVKARQ